MSEAASPGEGKVDFIEAASVFAKFRDSPVLERGEGPMHVAVERSKFERRFLDKLVVQGSEQ